MNRLTRSRQSHVLIRYERNTCLVRCTTGVYFHTSGAIAGYRDFKFFSEGTVIATGNTASSQGGGEVICIPSAVRFLPHGALI